MSVKERIMPALRGAFAAAMAFAALPSQALDNVWRGTGDGYWETASNWSEYATGDYWKIEGSPSSKAIKFKTAAAHAYNFAIATEGVTFSADSGACGLVQSASDVRVGAWETGSLAIESGTHVINELAVASAWWGKAVDGTLTMNGGKLTVSTASYIGNASEANASGTDGIVTVNSGELVFSQAPVLGVAYGTTGTIDIDGGTVATPGFKVGAGTATVNLDGGTLKPTEDGATLIPSGVLLTIGDTENTIELTGQTVTIEGAVAGVYGTGQTTGKLKVKGWGKLIVTGEIKLDTLTISPNDYYSSASDTYTLVVEAKSALLRHLYGAGDLVTTSGVNTGDGAFYGKISGRGGLRTRGATTLYGLSDFTGGITFADNASLTLVSSLDGISPLWRVDASDESTITTNSAGNVTAWASKANSYSFSNADSQMTVSEEYFGGKSAVLTQFSSLACPIGGNDSTHGKALIGTVRIVAKNGKNVDQWGGPMLYYPTSSASGAGNVRIGERSSQGYWTKQTGGSASDENGFWQNGTARDKAFYYSEKVFSVFNFARFANTTAENIGGFHSNLAIGELMGFNSNPTTAQRRQIETYLANKWNIEGMGKSLPEVDLSLGANSTLDLGGLDLTVNSFTGCGTVSNGTLRTVDNTYTQGEGALAIPAVDGATYYASSSRYKLRLDDAAGKSVTIVIPEDWFQSSGNLIFCQGDVTFVFEGEEIELKKNANGWYTNGDTTWTGESESAVKYWDDDANWNGSEGLRKFLDGVDASGVTFRSAATLEGNLFIETTTGGGVTFLAEGDGYGLSQPGDKGYNTFVGYAANGELTVDGGNHHFANDLIVGSGAKKSGVTGDFTLASGRVETEYWLLVGAAGGTGNVYVDGGELLVGVREFDGVYYETDNACIEMCRDANSKGNFYLTGGGVRSETGYATGCALLVGSGENSVATFTISSGYYTARNAGEIRLAGGAGSKGTLNVEGGTIYAGRIAKGAGTAEIFLDGGTLAPQASGTFIASGIETTIGENGGTIYLEGQDIVIDGDLVGNGKLTVTGYGSVTVNGEVTLSGLSFEPRSVSEGIVAKSPDYTIKFTADSITVSTLDGGAVVETANGITAQSGSFYGTIGGAGGFTKTGSSDSVMAFQGVGKYSGDLAIQGGVFNISSYLSGDMIYYDFDSSDTTKWSLEISGGVTNVNSMTGVAGLTFVPMFDTTTKIRLASSPEYFDGRPVMMLSEGSAYKPDYSGVWLRGKRAKSVFVVYQGNMAFSDLWKRNKNSTSYDEAMSMLDSGSWNDTIRFGVESFSGTEYYQEKYRWYGFSNSDRAWDISGGRPTNHTWPLFIDGSKDRSYVSGRASVLRFADCVAASDNRHDVFGRYEHTFNGAVAEVLGLSRQMPLEAYVAIEVYLMNKWSCDQTASYTYIPNVNVLMSAGATLDLNGMDVTVASFTGSGTIKNGTLVTADKTYTQGEGALAIPAVDGATYYASNSDSKLEITGGAGKTVTIHIPAGWLGANTNTYTYIACDAKTVNFTYGDANGEEKRTFFNMGDGRYRFGTAAAEEEDPVDPGDDDEPVDVDEPEEDGGYDFGSYSASNSLDNANEDALDDAESGLAFPGAYGWGRFAKGARASSSPSVYHVVNLNDSGTGSLRDAVSKPNRIVVFDVSGVIKISSRITFASNLYIAGQTAPGEGITVYGNGCSFSGANNLICRYIRWRMGHIGSSGKDCAGIANGANMIFDHCSFSWGLDETFSINPDGKGTYPQNITLQNCIFGQGLMTHSAGGLMQANYITLYRNLYVDNSTRNNKVKGINQYANNIVYNWKNGCYIMGGDSSGSSYCTIVGNLFINGPVSSSSNALGGGNSDFHFYGDDNWQDKNRNGRLDASLVTHNGGGNSVSLDYITAKIGAVPSLPMYAGSELLEKNLGKVGASLPYRDQSDCYMIDEVRTVGTSGGLITYEDTLAIGAPDTWTWWAGAARADSDNDGIPDAWEEANGLDKTKNDSLVLASNGRYNIENYINSITAGDRQFFLRAPVTLKADTTTTKTVKLTWRDYTYGEIGFSIEKEESSGVWTQVGRAKANATAFKVGELVPGTYYTFRVRAVDRQDGKFVYSDDAEITVSTREQQTGEVDIDTYKPNFTFKSGEQSYWDKSHRTWTQNDIYSNSDDGSAKVLLNTSGDEGVTITTNVAPASIVANGTGTMTVNRVGNITGATTINKGNIGTLKLVKGTNGTNAGTYTGKVVNHGGVIEFDSIANGGYASALGKSTSDPLNWVFDGGTYRYTGGSASTDRSATFRKDSTLEIANSGTTLTMTGAMEGTGDFILDGEGTLAIPNANTFFGSKTRNAVIKGGTLHLTTTGDSGSARNFANGNTIKNLYLAGGNVKFTSKDEEYQTYSVPIYIEDGTTNEISLASHCYMNSRLIGNGDVQFNIEHVRSVFKSNMSSFTGNVTAHGNWTKKSTGKYLPTFYHASYWNYPNTRFNLTGDIHMASKSRNVTCHLGGLSGTSGTYLSGSDTKSSGSGTTWYVGYANSNEEFAGTIDDYNSDRSAEGTTSIVKVGTGYWRLTGTSVHSGTTTVNGGALIVNGTLPASSAVIVNDGGTLQGNGTIHGSITVNDGGTIRAGDYISDDDEDASGGFDDDAYNNANLYFDGGITLNSGARVVIPVARTTSGDLVCPRLRPYTGTSFSIAEGVTLEFDLSKVDELKANEKIYIMSLVPSFKDHEVFDAIEPATPGHGLKWDTSKLYKDKYISVVKDDDFVWNLEPAAASGRTALVAASSTDAAFDALTVKRPATTAYISEETYKEYFKYSYSKSGGNYTVSVTGIADDVVDEVVNSTIDALLNQDADSDGYITIAVKPGLYYGIAPGTRANIDAQTRYLAGDFTWKFKKPSGNSKFVRIDIGASEADPGAFTGASVLVSVLTVTNGGTLDLSTFSNATATPRGMITLRGKATLALLDSQTANLDVGDSFAIFDNPAQWTVKGSFTSIDPEKPGANMAWDMSRLNDGSLALSVISKIESVSPAEPLENLTEKDANELVANGTIAAPDDLTSEQQAYYARLFSLVAFPSGDMWAVAALMNENGTNTVAECAQTMIESEAVAEMLAAISAADANAQTVSVPDAIPGLYYSVSSAATIKNMKETGERKRAGSSGVVELTFPHYKTGSAFYQILINSRK